MGRLQHRLSELREEIAWAELEIENTGVEGDVWKRAASTKQSETGAWGTAVHLTAVPPGPLLEASCQPAAA